jgi:hypothetical protein
MFLIKANAISLAEFSMPGKYAQEVATQKAVCLMNVDVLVQARCLCHAQAHSHNLLPPLTP